MLASEVADIDNLYYGHKDGSPAFLEVNEGIFAREGVVVAFEAGRSSTEEDAGMGMMGNDDGYVAGMIAWGGILLLVGVLVLFVDDDEAEALEGEEHGRAYAEDDVVGLLRELAEPDVGSLGIGTSAVIDAQPFAKYAAQTVGELGSESNLGDEVEHLPSLGYGVEGKVDVDFGFS
jgi:hypothetical protein